MNDNWIKSYGTLQVRDDAIRLMVSMDFIKYYKQFVDKQFRIFSDCPAHGGHVTISNKKINKNLSHKAYKHWNNKKVYFEYNTNINVGGQNKGFMNFWMNIKSTELDTILKQMGISQNLHLTISNTKSGIRPYIWMK